MKTGDMCEKGQLLVQGQVELVNDSQEITGYDYVCADADIFVRHEISYYDQFSMKNKQAVYTGERKKGFSVSDLDKKRKLSEVYRGWDPQGAM